MINAIGTTNIRLEPARTAAAQPVAAKATTPAKPVVAVEATTQVAREVGAGAPSLAADLVSAMGPPLDMAKIARIRTAIAEGRYEIQPDRIADRMVDMDLPARS